ncbi:MAG: MmcQ/YjbR family DNA-binding protein [Hymenobacter sp.]
MFKVGGKLFALTNIDTFGSINLKCDPARAVELREAHDYVLPGYHMNKQHWNTVLIGTGAPVGQLRELIDHSYELVLTSLPKAIRLALRGAAYGLLIFAPQQAA